MSVMLSKHVSLMICPVWSIGAHHHIEAIFYCIGPIRLIRRRW